MDRETIIKLAREAGWPDSLVAPVIVDKLADFAKLIAEHERELCAQVAEQIGQYKNQHGIAAAIRARGQ